MDTAQDRIKRTTMIPMHLKLLRMIATKKKNASTTINKFKCHFFTDKLGLTLLHYSAEYGNEHITQYLLDKGCNVNAQDVWGKTPLMTAVSGDNEAIVKILLSAGADINILNNEKKGALHMVFARHDNMRILVAILNAVRQQFFSSEDTAKALIDAGCHLYQAAYLEDPAIIRYMLLRGFPVDSKHPSCNLTALHTAVPLGDLETVKLLLEYGADVEALDSCGATPLYDLYIRGIHNRAHLEILQILLDSGVSLTQCASDGKFQIGRTLINGDREAIDTVVLQPNLDLTTKDAYNGRTVLHYLALNTSRGIAEGIKLHVDKFDVDATDNTGYSPLFHAIINTNVQMVECLLEAGADANFVCSQNGITPICMSYAESIKSNSAIAQDQIFELLLQHKADPQLNIGSDDHPDTFFQLKANSRKMKAAIAHVAISEELGTPANQITLSGINAHQPRKYYFDRCRRLLKRKITSSLTVFDLVTCSKKKMARYLGDRELVQKLDRLRIKNKVKLTFPYYFNTVEKRHWEGRTYEQASVVICKIFGDRIDKGHLVTRAIMNYLDIWSLRALYKTLDCNE